MSQHTAERVAPERADCRRYTGKRFCHARGMRPGMATITPKQAGARAGPRTPGYGPSRAAGAATGWAPHGAWGPTALEVQRALVDRQRRCLHGLRQSRMRVADA